MKLTTGDIAHIILAVALLLAFAHGAAYLFKRLRQPAVIGEILGGLLLGPTVLGQIWPEGHRVVFQDSLVCQAVLGAFSQFGLLTLMFCSGLEIRSAFQKEERRTAILITLTGLLIPFGIGLMSLQLFDPADYLGPAQNRTAFLIVFAIAIAVTSIPVISRIFFDLGILETAFARIVLAAAVIEDIILYVLLSIAVALVGSHHGSSFGLVETLAIDPSSNMGSAYHVGVNIVFFIVALIIGPFLYRAVTGWRYNLPRRNNPTAYLLLFLVVMTGIAVYLGITPMFGAFVAGMVAGTSSDDARDARESIKTFSFAFFIPIYFAIVGLRLDLTKSFNPLHFLLFLTFACLVKAISVYFGARLAKESRNGSINIAVAMNARGGPGIVLASEALAASIINEAFYAWLILLAVLTSMLAGSWLDFVLRTKRPLR